MVLLMLMVVATAALVVLFMFMVVAAAALVVLFMFMVVAAAALVMVLLMLMVVATAALVVLFMFMVVAAAALMMLFMFMVVTAAALMMVLLVLMVVAAAALVMVLPMFMVVATAAGFPMFVVVLPLPAWSLGSIPGVDHHIRFNGPGYANQLGNQSIRVRSGEPQLLGSKGDDGILYLGVGIELCLDLGRAVGAVQIFDDIYLPGHREPSFDFDI